MNKPLVYYVISLIIGSTASLLIKDNIFIGAVLTASFLGLMFLTINRRFFPFILIFFLIGLVNFYAYFNVNFMDMTSFNIRVIEKKDYYVLGDCFGKKVILQGKTGDLKEGEKLHVVGNFKEEPKYEKGIIGSLQINSYNKCKEDYITKVHKFKYSLYDKFISNLGKEKAAIVISLCFGDSEYLTENQWNELKRLGVVHAISVSGMHMSIIYGTLEKFFGFTISILISFIYALFTGSRASTIRAFIMIVILKLSKRLYQNYDPISSLSLAAIILLMKKPYYFLDVGFVLSFLATLGIILYYSKLQRKLYKLPTKINKTISMSISAQCFSMPFASLYFNSFSLGFILGNMFLLPIYSLIVVLGNASLIVVNFEKVFKLFCGVLNIVITAILGATHLLMQIAPTEAFLSSFDCFIVMLIYLCYVFYKHGFKRCKYLPLMLFIFILMENYSIVPQITYFNLGQGDSVLVKYKNQSILISNYDDAKGILKLKDKVHINKVKADYRDRYTLNMGRNCNLSINKVKQSNDQYINILLKSYSNNYILFTRKEEVACFNDDIKINCDIINTPNLKCWDLKEQESITYIIIFGRVITLLP